MSSILRCISGENGIAVVPDFLSKKELENGNVVILWDGFNHIENTLYFGTRKNSMYAQQIAMVQDIFEKEMI
jgi:DNA-binding transcriptional LysR family regulator